MDPSWLGREVEVEVEAPAGSFVKRRPDGTVDVVSPLPVPWNYGFVPGAEGGDGDPLDALLLGPRRPRGSRHRGVVLGVVHMVDAGATDDKLVVGRGPAPRRAIRAFFTLYVVFKRVLYRLRRTPGPTRVEGIRWAREP